MLSGRLIQLIETNQEQIVSNVIRAIRQHPEMAQYQKLPDAELRARARDIIEQLDYWLIAPHEAEIGQVYEQLGKSRFEESVPLHEAVRALSIIKYKMLDFAREQVFSKTAVDLYAEQELARRTGRFFDALTIHMVHGYETAWRRANHAANWARNAA